MALFNCNVDCENERYNTFDTIRYTKNCWGRLEFFSEKSLRYGHFPDGCIAAVDTPDWTALSDPFVYFLTLSAIHHRPNFTTATKILKKRLDDQKEQQAASLPWRYDASIQQFLVSTLNSIWSIFVEQVSTSSDDINSKNKEFAVVGMLWILIACTLAFL